VPRRVDGLRRSNGIRRAHLLAQRRSGSRLRQPEELHWLIHPQDGRDEDSQRSVEGERREHRQGRYPLFQTREDRFQGGGEHVARDTGVDGAGLLK